MQLHCLLWIIGAALFLPASVWASEDHFQLHDRISLDRSLSMEETPELMGVLAKSRIEQTVSFSTVCEMSVRFDIIGSAVQGGTPKKLIMGRMITRESIDLSEIASSDITSDGSALKISLSAEDQRTIPASVAALTDGGLRAVVMSYYGAMVFGDQGNWSIKTRGMYEDLQGTSFEGSVVVKGPVILLGQASGDPTLSAIALRQLVRKCSGR